MVDADGAVKAADLNVPTSQLHVGKAGTGAGTIVGGAIECGLFCEDLLDRGTTLTLVAKPFRESRFVRRLGNCRGTRPTCVLRVSGPTKAIAVFAP